MKSYNKLLVALFSVFSVICYGQRTVDIRLSENDRLITNDCFDIELKSPHGQDMFLAGQNYRLFYDASKLAFNKKDVKSYLDKKAYTEIELINTTQNNIGFISISIDGRELNDKVLTLSRHGQWHSIANICFENTSVRSYELTWAHKDRTLQFASATVALSEWTESNRQQILEPNEVLDYTNMERIITDGSRTFDIKVYPNPLVDYVTVEVPDEHLSSKLIIKDVIGREVVFDNINGKSKLNYDLSNWPGGMYTFEVLNVDGQLIYSNQLVKSSP